MTQRKSHQMELVSQTGQNREQERTSHSAPPPLPTTQPPPQKPLSLVEETTNGDKSANQSTSEHQQLKLNKRRQNTTNYKTQT